MQTNPAVEQNKFKTLNGLKVRGISFPSKIKSLQSSLIRLVFNDIHLFKGKQDKN